MQYQDAHVVKESCLHDCLHSYLKTQDQDVHILMHFMHALDVLTELTALSVIKPYEKDFLIVDHSHNCLHSLEILLY